MIITLDTHMQTENCRLRAATINAARLSNIWLEPKSPAKHAQKKQASKHRTKAINTSSSRSVAPFASSRIFRYQNYFIIPSGHYHYPLPDRRGGITEQCGPARSTKKYFTLFLRTYLEVKLLFTAKFRI